MVDVDTLRAQLENQIEGEVRFDRVSRALYSTDASVYQIVPLGVVVIADARRCRPRRRDLSRHRCSAHHARRRHVAGRPGDRGGRQLDSSKYLNRVLELNAPERWARVEPASCSTSSTPRSARTACASRPTSRPPAAPRSAA